MLMLVYGNSGIRGKDRKLLNVKNTIKCSQSLLTLARTSHHRLRFTPDQVRLLTAKKSGCTELNKDVS